MAIERKNANGSNKTSPEQDAYLEQLKGCNVATLASNDYDEVIIFLHNQRKDVKKTHAMLLASEDQRTRTDFSRNDNPAYWRNKLHNNEILLNECKCQDRGPEKVWRLLNKKSLQPTC